MTGPKKAMILRESRMGCQIYRIERRDGVVKRYTDHDSPVWFEGEQYVPSDEPDALETGGGSEGRQINRAAGLREQSTAVAGLISSSGITTEDIRAGRYRRAVVWVRALDPRAPWAGSAYGKRCIVSDLQLEDGVWQANIASEATHHLAARRGATVGRRCRCTFLENNQWSQCTRPKTPGGGPSLIKEEWEVLQQGTGGYAPTVLQVDGPRQFRVSIPKRTLASLVAVSGGVDITTGADHFFGGSSPTAGSRIKIPFGIRGSSNTDLNQLWTSATVKDADEFFIPYTGGGGLGSGGAAAFEPPAEWFADGLIRWIGGDNAGEEHNILGSGDFVFDADGNRQGYVDVTLYEAPGLPVQVGDTCELQTGCDRQITTCVDRDNVQNFDAEPTLESTTKLTETPNAR